MMVNWDGEERRKFVRGEAPCKVFIFLPSGGVVSAYAEDLSQNGVRVIISEKLEKDTSVEMELYTGEEPIFCMGRVAWIKERVDLQTSGQPLYDTGIECHKRHQLPKNIHKK